MVLNIKSNPSKLDHPIFSLLDALDNKSVQYVSWKNNHEISIALSGHANLDIFVPQKYRAIFMHMVGEHDWLYVENENKLAQFPWVIHLYKPDDNHHLYHLHVYFKVITGESWIKEYMLPFDKFLIENRDRSKEGIWILNPRAQAYLFAVRHLLKGGSITSRILYREELDSYRQEWLDCLQTTQDITDYGPIPLSKYVGDSGLSATTLDMPKILAALKFRMSVSPFLRVSIWSLPFRRVHNLIVRAMKSRILKRKKIFPNGGLVIAISGVDGSGKSTMLGETYKFFSRFLTVDRYGLGRPQNKLIEILRKNMTFDKDNRNTSLDIGSRSNRLSNTKNSISAMVLSLLRLRTARKVMSKAIQGRLVLVDRWPTDKMGKMDGPRLTANAGNGLLMNACATIENWAYSRMPRADVCFFLNVPLDVALERNRTRKKEEKECDEEIIARFRQNQEYSPLAHKVLIFENGGAFDVVSAEFLKLVWHEIVAHKGLGCE